MAQFILIIPDQRNMQGKQGSEVLMGDLLKGWTKASCMSIFPQGVATGSLYGLFHFYPK
jgi:hypothetical protein